MIKNSSIYFTENLYKNCDVMNIFVEFHSGFFVCLFFFCFVFNVLNVLVFFLEPLIIHFQVFLDFGILIDQIRNVCDLYLTF